MTNLFKAFLDLLPSRPLQVGVVSSIADGVATIALPGGGVVQARGDAVEGKRVFVRDGLIEGPAPELPFFAVEV